ncbi:hypothetical protein Tco_1378554 [Tanacetum coccineum]
MTNLLTFKALAPPCLPDEALKAFVIKRYHENEVSEASVREDLCESSEIAIADSSVSTPIYGITDAVPGASVLKRQREDLGLFGQGGANALNVNRMLLHKSSTPSPFGGEDLQSAKVLVKKVFEESVTKMGEDSKNTKSIKWELGACWVQHLQNQASAKTDSKTATDAKVEPAVKGLGKGLLKDLKKKSEDKSSKSEQESANNKSDDSGNKKDVKMEEEKKIMWKNVIPEAAYLRLKESNTGLHLKSPDELIDMAHKYYDDTALPKLVADFGSIELSPVDGRTLTDSMHTRGLRMCSFGRVVELADKLPHVQSLSGSIASCLNVLLGSNDDELKWK